ncbi:MAG: glycosyltransferase family 1 protein [Candidatus Omnitrophica bacterium]|nr:glycosyltransferase family 1 protein [Candidatus Omnitrophota bacterium]
MPSAATSRLLRDGGRGRYQELRERYPNSFIGPADHAQLASIYRRARVGFNYSIHDDVNMRIFEVLAAETLLVTNQLRHDDLGRLGLEDRRHLVLYRSPRELFDLIEYYLAHPAERQAIAQEGAHVVRARHTYVRRLEQLLATVSRQPTLTVGQPGGESGVR